MRPDSVHSDKSFTYLLTYLLNITPCVEKSKRRLSAHMHALSHAGQRQWSIWMRKRRVDKYNTTR